jgi:SAM-dependent methyltransferase
MLDSLKFNNLSLNSRNQILFGEDLEDEYFIKIEIESNKNKTKNLDQEYEVIKELNNKGCRSCPVVHELGSISKESLLQVLGADAGAVVKKSPLESFRYMIQDFIPHHDSVRLSDIVFSVLEQKSLGTYQGDIKPANLRFDKRKSVCYIIDYDQAIELSNEQINLDNRKFFDFCSDYDKEKYGFGDWLRHFDNFSENDLDPLFVGEAFNLGTTTILNKQKTTNSETGFYHSINNERLFIEGSRGLEARAKALNAAEFKTGETVLDVGCNMGLLCEYLYDRGCKATGFDNDKRIPIAAKMVYNIMGKDIEFYDLDLDDAEELPKFDTVMLFSVIHHTRDIVSNAKKIANCCKRIFLESKLIERGKQPYGEQWVETGGWNLSNVDELKILGENLFPGFKFKQSLGQVDKHRYILEFVRQ